MPDRQLTAWIVLDQSASMHFGTADRRKADVAEGAALVVGRFVARRSDRLGVVAFGTDRERVAPPAGGRNGMLGLLRTLATDAPEEGAGTTSLARALRTVAASRTSAGLVTIVSDFRGPLDWRPALTEVAGRHTVLAIEIADPRETELVDVGELTLIDPETGRTLRVDTADRRLRATFREAATAERSAVAAEFSPARHPPSPPLDPGLLAARLRPRSRHDRTTDMTFLAPLLLLGLLLVPVLLGLYAWAQRRRSRYAVRFTNLDLLANLAPRRPAWRRHVPPAIYLAAVAALVLGLARPTMVVAVPREDATVLLAIDVSGSMKATDVAPTRLDAAREAARSFIDQLPEGIRVGIVAFASRPVTLVAPTDRPRPARRGARRAAGARRDRDGRRADAGPRHRRDDPGRRRRERRRDDAGWATRPRRTHRPTRRPPPTPTRLPRRTARSTQPTGEPLVAAILLSDGANSVGDAEPLDAAQRAASLGVPIYTIALGHRRPARSRSRTISASSSRSTCHRTPRRSPRSRRSRARRRSMRRPPSDLSAVYDNLQSRIGYTQEEQEVTSWFAAAALVLVVVAAGLSAVWFGRLP